MEGDPDAARNGQPEAEGAGGEQLQSLAIAGPADTGDFFDALWGDGNDGGGQDDQDGDCAKGGAGKKGTSSARMQNRSGQVTSPVCLKADGMAGPLLRTDSSSGGACVPEAIRVDCLIPS